MINVKSKTEIEHMRSAGKIVSAALTLAGERVKSGMTTATLNRIIHDYITSCGAYPSFLNYRGFPAASCISIDKQVVHGIPSDKVVIQEGMIVSVDVGACVNGYHADAARSFLIGECGEDKKRLVKVTQECFFEAVKVIKSGVRTGDIGAAVFEYATSNGYGVVRALTGHGIGGRLHESPDVPNFGQRGRGPRLDVNMAIAIEPMINMGADDVVFLPDGWTVVTADDLPSAHYENTVLITEKGCEIITL